MPAQSQQSNSNQQQQSQQQAADGDQNNSQAQGATPSTWESFLESQPAEIKALYETHSAGLLNTVKATRQERDDLGKQLKALAKKQEEGSELQTQLSKLGEQLEAAERKADFLELATNPAVECLNPSAAWVIAQAQELFDKKGAPDWAAIKAAAPQLFGKAHVNHNAGTGTHGDNLPGSQQSDMNSWIRQEAGRE